MKCNEDYPCCTLKCALFLCSFHFIEKTESAMTLINLEDTILLMSAGAPKVFRRWGGWGTDGRDREGISFPSPTLFNIKIWNVGLGRLPPCFDATAYLSQLHEQSNIIFLLCRLSLLTMCLDERHNILPFLALAAMNGRLLWAYEASASAARK